MELEEKLKASKVPMIIVHFGEDFETTHTEEYNLENFELSELQIESFARITEGVLFFLIGISLF